jgi:hypothetical protein
VDMAAFPVISTPDRRQENEVGCLMSWVELKLGSTHSGAQYIGIYLGTTACSA